MDASTPSTTGPSIIGKGPAANLAARRAAGEVHPDAVQEKVVLRLQAVYDRLAAAAAHPAKPGLLARLGLVRAPKPPDGPHGLYIWGPVGRGKSMLMDLFFADAPVAKKRRVHFHEFMLEVQERLHRRREELLAKGAPPEADTIVPIAREIAQRDAAALLRRVPGHQHRRCDDPGPPVRDPVRRGHHGDRHLQPQARRSLQGRPAARPLPALHRSDQGAPGDPRAGRRARLPPRSAAQLRRLPDAAAAPGRTPSSTRPFAR